MPGPVIDPRADILPPLAACRVAPLADALAPVIARLDEPGDGVARPDGVACGFVDPAEVLALTLGLGGSLELDAHLGDLEAAPDSAPGPAPHGGVAQDVSGADAGAVLREAARTRFAKLERGVQRRLGALAEGRSRVPGPERFLAALAEREALVKRGGRIVGVVAGEQCESYLVAVTNLLDRIRGEARGLRVELGLEIAGLGPRAADLEALDALLGRASVLFTGQWLARIPQALGADFARRAAAAVKALPRAPEPSDLESWYAPRGFVDDLLDTATAALEAVVEHERQALFGLIEAAIELDSRGARAAAAGLRDGPPAASRVGESESPSLEDRGMGVSR